MHWYLGLCRSNFLQMKRWHGGLLQGAQWNTHGTGGVSGQSEDVAAGIYQLSLLQRLATIGWDASLESRVTRGSILMEVLAVRFSVLQANYVTTLSQRLLLSCEIVIRSSLLPVVHRWIMMQKVRHFGGNQHAQWSSSSCLALHMWVTRSSCQQCSTPEEGRTT